MRKIKEKMNSLNIARTLIVACALLCAGAARAQTYLYNYQNETVKHKPAKWYDLRTSLGISTDDDFDADEESQYTTLADGFTKIQSAHETVDTIYMHRGTTTELRISDYHPNLKNSRSYQRWYDYETDGNVMNGTKYLLEATILTYSGNEQNATNMYVFSNGIVGKPLTTKNLHSMYFTFPDDESINEYVVACDVSGYQDFSAEYKNDTSDSPSFKNGGYYEPTISHRFIYYIIAIEDENSWAYKRLTAGEPIDEEDITMPATRIPNNTNEMVALPMDARSYITPNGNTNEANGNLTISLGDNNTAGISLVTNTISGRDRVIHFTYPNTNTDDGTQSVNTPESGEDAIATIEVKRGNTVVARFNLTFKEESRLLSQSQLKVINEGTYTENGLLSGYTFRNPALLSEEYELLTELNFDYDADIAAKYGQAEYYPFPLGWNDISYGFYDGSKDYKNGFAIPSAPCPEWGYYGIQSCYVECSYDYGWASQTAPVDTESIRFNSSGKQSTYHLYADASDRPDIIAKLPFKENLCSGTKLYVTAWVKCALSTNANNAAALFTLLGVSTDDDGNTKYTPVYRFQTGQIPNSLKTQVASSNWTLKDTYEGFETTRNDWMQVYFTFTNDADVDYDSYVLQINNNSASTAGGDIYIDDIRIYIATPEATITQLNPTCTGDETLMNMTLDWERLTSRLGVNTETTGNNASSGIDYCFVDKEVYENYLAENSDAYAGAIEAAVVTISDSESDENGSEYKTLYFYNSFNQNTAYEEDTHPQLASEIDDFLYRTTDSNGIQQLTADFYATLTPNRTYWMLMKPHTGGTVDASYFAEDITSPCAIKTPFYVTSQTLLRLNGQVVDPTTDYCEGQIVNFTVELRVPTSVDESGLQTYTTVSDGVYFDWFFGTEEEYTNTSYFEMSYNGTSLKDALTTFRNILQFGDYDDLTGVTAGKYTSIDGSTEVELTQAEIDIIKYYLDAGKLILHKSSLNITITSGGLTLVVQPIPMQISPDESISDDEWENLCWTYIPLELSVTGVSPTLRAGFSDVNYPSDTFDPCLRIGLDQINSTSESNPLTVNMRGISYTSDNIDHLGMISDEAYQKIFLISTDDPAYASFFSEEVGEFDEYSLPIGTIVSLNAKTSEITNVATLYFDTTTETNGFTFTPREGYTYTFALHFQEYTSEDESETSSACYGMFNIPMKVVPKYLVWQGTDGVTNWNKDDNWKRADRTELKKTDSSYDTNETNTTDNGFVPMLFSNVVMPENSKVQLYMAGFNSDTPKEWKEDEIPDGMEAATDDIQYDLMVYEDSDNNISTQPYRVNLCDSIHFEKGAQMLHAEQLLYDNASMDIPIVNNTWVTVSTPLKDIMSGDWYTQTTGSQETEYFQDITFTEDYSRVNPAVFQRSWGDAATILTTASATTGNVVSFAANWSATYNDASVPYYAGAGYSIRGWKSGTDSLLFRMPKADESYDYSTTTFTRDNNGKLKISDLVDRSTQANDYNDYTAKDTVMVTLTAANGDESYLMVGNPYMTALDVQAFLSNDYNKNTLAQEYWYIADDGTLTAVTYDSDNDSWTANTKAYIAPYSVFYVKAAQEDAEEVEVFFTKDMQAFDTSDDGKEVTTALGITATSESGKSVATVNYASTANNGYDRLEDAELLSGIGENDGPQVFTAADNTAISGNQVKDLTRIPLGVYADDDETVTVTFDNVAAIEDASLYDAETLTTTTLYDGYELQVTGNSYGRYFLMGTGPGTTSINEVTTETGVQVSSLLHRQVVVTSNTAIKEVTVWSASGALLGKVSLNGDYTCTLNGIASGVAIVKVTTGDSSITKKLMIK